MVQSRNGKQMIAGTKRQIVSCRKTQETQANRQTCSLILARLLGVLGNRGRIERWKPPQTHKGILWSPVLDAPVLGWDAYAVQLDKVTYWACWIGPCTTTLKQKFRISQKAETEISFPRRFHWKTPFNFHKSPFPFHKIPFLFS